MRAASRARSCKLASIKKAKRMRSILLKGFGFNEIAEAEDNACIGYPNLVWVYRVSGGGRHRINCAGNQELALINF